MSDITIKPKSQSNIKISQPRSDYHLPIASETVLGGVKVGNNLRISEDGVLSAVPSDEYELPIATTQTLGGIKVGNALSITNAGTLNVNVDNTLNPQSSNPVQNSVLTSELNALDNTDTSLSNRITALEQSSGGASQDISSLVSEVNALNDSVDDLSTSVENLTLSVTTNTNNISVNANAISALDDRVTTNESNIRELQQGSEEIASDVSTLKQVKDLDIQYTSLLPVSTWTSGKLSLHRRGFIAYLFAELEGDLLLGANGSTTIYTFTDPDNIPLYRTYEPIETDAGSAILVVDDQGNVSINNPTSSTMNITKLYGTVPLVY